MASEEAIQSEVARLFQSFGGRVADGSVLLAYDAALSGDNCTDYQLEHAVTEAVLAGGAFPPSAGDLRDRARDQPRDIQAAVARKRRESQPIVYRTPGIDYVPKEARLLLEGKAKSDHEIFRDAHAETFPDEPSLESRQRRDARRRQHKNAVNEETFAERKARHKQVLAQITAEESEATKQAIKAAKASQMASMRKLSEKLKGIGIEMENEQ